MSKKMLSSLLLLLVVYGAIVFGARSGQPNRGVDVAGSSQSAYSSGSKAFIELWGSLHRSLSTWTDAPALFANQPPSAAFVSVEPDPSQYTDKDAAALIAWVKQGGHVIWMTRETDAVTSALGLSVANTANRVQVLHVWNGAEPSSITHLSFTAHERLVGHASGTVLRIWKTPSGSNVLLELKEGKGTIVIGTIPEVWENGWIGRANNLEIPWTLLRNQTVLWDEYGHGVEDTSMLAEVFGHGREIALGWLVIGVCLYLWTAFTRFGKPGEHSSEQARFGNEFMHALAWHLRSKRLRKDMKRYLERAIIRDMSKSLGLGDSRVSTKDIRVAVRSRGRQELVEAFDEWEEALKPHRRISWSKLLQRFKALKKTAQGENVSNGK